MRWDSHFQTLSRSEGRTASFGGTWSTVGAEVPEEVKEYGIPIGAGLALGLIAKVAGVTGIVPVVIGLGGAAAAFVVTRSMKSDGPAPELAPAVATAPQPAQYRAPAAVAHQVPVQTAAPQPKVATGSPWPVLVSLSRDGAVLSVADVQNALNAAGFASPYLVVDGKAGNQTTMAVKRAQAKFGLTQTGLTTDGNLKIKLQQAVLDKAGFAKADAASDALVAEMKTKGYA